MKKAAVLGYGVVGSGVVEVLQKNCESIKRRAGDEIEVKYILDIRDFPDHPLADRFTKRFEDIVNDPEISVVIEVMGGIEPAFTYTMAALESGKSVVTSNKELVATKGAQLLAAAKRNQVNFLFEASVGGGIPIIRPLHQCLAANEIDEIAGILNGTTNYILTRMIHDGAAFEDALRQAQELGYAERDPSADVNGDDACRKICILASLAFGKHVYPEQVQTEGITAITAQDVQYAGDWGGVIKLIARTKRLEHGCEAMVSPAFIRRDSQLAGVDDVFNGILVRGDATGDVVFYGKGAGKLPTASAVVGDVIDCVKAKGTIESLHWSDSTENQVADAAEYETAMYLRLRGVGVEAAAHSFGDIFLLRRPNQDADELAFITPVLKEGEIARKLQVLKENGAELLGKIKVLEY